MSEVLIKELTEEQKAKFPAYVKKWIDLSRNTKRADRSKCEELIKEIYTNKGYAVPKTFEWYGSPLAIIKKYKFKDWDFCYGSQECWLSFYDFFLEECKLECCKVISPFIQLASEIGWWLPTEDVCLCSENPTLVNFRDDGVLHNESGPVVAYADGFEIYALNGIRVPKEYVMTPFNEIPAQWCTNEKNADKRRELIRKIGIERLCTELKAECIDKKKITTKVPNIKENQNSITCTDFKDEEVEYELLLLDYAGDNRMRPYLRMTNMSIGCQHVEGVHPDCKTVDEALAFRNGTKVFPKVLS